MSIHVMPSSHLILWCPFLLLPSIFPSLKDFSSESAVHIRWPKYWNFSISPSNEYPELISLKIDWFDLAVQGTGVFSSTTVQRNEFFGALPSLRSSSHSHTWPLGRPLALTIWTFVGRVMALLFNTLSRFVTAFLPRSNCLLISWLQSPSTVILVPKKRKSVTTSTFFPFYLP